MDEQKELLDFFICPITQELMENPVIASDGHCYEKKAIQNWLNRGNLTSPFTGIKIPNKNLIDNLHLKSMINQYKSNPFLFSSKGIFKFIYFNQ